MATARKGKIEESPGYCKAEDLANLFALTGQWINQLTRDGVLKKRDTPAGKRYNVVESTRAYVQYLRDKAAGRGEKGIPESKELEKFEAEVRIKQAKAQIAELEAQELQGIMHRSEDVAALTEDLLYTVRDSLMALPGRLAVDEEMMQEITAIKQAVRPSETLFVVDAMTGQDAVNTAREFNDRLDFDGVVLTKLDGDTRGGAAISIRAVVNKPLKFISSGEKMDALQVFHPERMADRILGMGDIVSLVERAQEQYDEDEARKLKKKIIKDQFNFNDFLTQIGQIKKMGNLKDLASMIPGVGKALKNVEISDDVFKQTESIIFSMTPAERENPSLINTSRKNRIAKGSGVTIVEVNRLLKQFEDTRKMMKAVAAGGKPRLR